MAKSENTGRPKGGSTGRRQDVDAGNVRETSPHESPGAMPNEPTAGPDLDGWNACLDDDGEPIPGAGWRAAVDGLVGGRDAVQDGGPDDPAVRPADRRSERIDEYVDQAIKVADPLAANVGVINGDLMVIAYALRRALDQSLREVAGHPERISEVLPTVSQMLKVVKQLDRLSQLVLRVNAMNEASGDVGQLTQRAE